MPILPCALTTVVYNHASPLPKANRPETCRLSLRARAHEWHSLSRLPGGSVLYLMLMSFAASLDPDATDSIGDCPGSKEKKKKRRKLKFNIFSLLTVLLRIIFSVV